MNRPGCRALVLAACLVVTTAAAEVPPEIAAGCPQVFRIHGDGSNDDTLDLLVLSDGFTEDQLDLYRCGVTVLIDGLLRLPPFDRVASSLNVYRIDQAASREGIEVPASCPADTPVDSGPFSGSGGVPRLVEECRRLAERDGLPPETLGRPVFGPGSFCSSCTSNDLEFFHDPQIEPDCRVLWTGVRGMRRIWRLTRCAPKADIVIVVANSVSHAGSGTAGSHPPLAVVTLFGVDQEPRPAELLGHELGHALGLLDEYAKSIGELPEFFAGRNVVRGQPDVPEEPPPWAGRCETAGDGPPGRCTVLRGPRCIPDPEPRPIPSVGLIEGAFYSPCRFFRASEECLLDEETSYCAGCTVYLERLFRELGLREAR